MSRILRATVEDSIDRLEQAGGEAVMREAIREADRAVDQAKAEREAVTVRRLQAARQQGLLAQRVEALTGKARFAVEGGRDDLAEAALAQQIDFEAQAAKLVQTQAQAREEEAQLGEGLAALEARRAQMAEALDAYVLARREASAGSDALRPDMSAARKVDAAEQAFDRAMAGANGCGPARTDAATIGRVAEIDVLQRSAAIAERLAALKAQRAA
nr:PspA/IM30 family protein [Methylobacterium trifolii]